MNLLLTGAWNYTESDLARFREMGIDSIYFQQDERESLTFDPACIDAAVCNGLFLYHDIAEFSRLQYIQLTSAGLDRVPLEEIKRRNITLHNARGVYSIPMAEYALGGILSLYKQFSHFESNRQQNLWEKRRDLRELTGQTASIIGAGSVGCEAAKRLVPFGVTVYGIDTILEPKEGFIKILPLEKLDFVLSQSDIVILTLPLTESTRGMFNEQRFNQIKEGAVFVNIARGPLVDEAALCRALDSSRLSGAVLDVFNEEPLPPASALWQKKNVILTPHISFISPQNKKRLTELVFSNLENWEKQSRP